MSRTLRSITIGVIAGAIALVAFWLVESPRRSNSIMLTEVIRLDMLGAAARKPVASPTALLDESAALERTVESFVVNDLSLGQALTKLGQQAGVNIVVDWRSFSQYNPPLNPDLPVSVTLHHKTVDQILRAIFEPLKQRYEHYGPYEVVSWFVLDGIIYITDRADLSDEAAPLRVYDVRNLMLSAAPFAAAFHGTTRPAEADYDPVMQGSEKDILDRLITALTSGHVGIDSEIRSVHYFSGRILIRATPNGHRDVEARLELLRRTK